MSITSEREFFIDNLLVRIHSFIMMMRWTGLALWKFKFPFPGSLTSTFLATSSTAVVGILHVWRIEVDDLENMTCAIGRHGGVRGFCCLLFLRASYF